MAIGELQHWPALPRKPFTQPQGRPVLHIGLLNNMPDNALEQTERQFFRLIGGASQEVAIHWHLLNLRSLRRGEAATLHLLHQNYRDASALFGLRLDGLVVTGTEPVHQNLRDESYWPEFAELLDWIALEGPPTIFSCLAAHAAVLRYSGIVRERLEEKRFGLFEHTVRKAHPLTSSLLSPLKIAHSRWNEVGADILDDAGYDVLTHSVHAGPDLFVRRARNLMLFFQGHPEYDSDTLAREYRREVRRYVDGETATFPALPLDYFTQNETKALLRFRERVFENRNSNIMDQFPPLVGRRAGRGSGAGPIFKKWLHYADELRAERSGPPPARLTRAAVHA